MNLTKNLFSEFSIGGVLINETRIIYDWWYDYPYFYYKSEADFGLGLSAALGRKIRINNNTAFLAKIRMLGSYSFNKEFYMFINALCGVAFNTKKTSHAIKEQQRYLGITLLSGGIKPGGNNQYLWTGSYGVEFSYKTSSLIELLLTGVYNNIVREEKHSAYRHYMISITGGGRFTINNSPVSAFIEFGGGYYAYTFQLSSPMTGEAYNPTKEYGGVFIGTGTKIKVIRQIDIIVKSNLHFLFNENEATPNYVSLHGGLRFNL